MNSLVYLYFSKSISTMNTIAYIIYLSITGWITIVVGTKLHKHGYWYIIDLFGGNKVLTKSVNQLLLVGYYLLNLGYVAVTITKWQTIQSIPRLIEVIITKVGYIVIGLALMHYINMAVLLLVSHFQSAQSINNK